MWWLLLIPVAFVLLTAFVLTRVARLNSIQYEVYRNSKKVSKVTIELYKEAISKEDYILAGEFNKILKQLGVNTENLLILNTLNNYQ